MGKKGAQYGEIEEEKSEDFSTSNSLYRFWNSLYWLVVPGEKPWNIPYDFPLGRVRVAFAIQRCL
jgi:hypothetical protein